MSKPQPKSQTDTIADGKFLCDAMNSIEETRVVMHKKALAIKLALIPNGEFKKANKYLPSVTAFLNGVFAGSNDKPGTIKTRKTRLIQMIATTTAAQLGGIAAESAKPKEPKSETRAPRTPNASDKPDSDKPDSDKSSEQSKSAKRRADIQARLETILDASEKLLKMAVKHKLTDSFIALIDDIAHSADHIGDLLG
jgi:hypothetical protein